jgi:AcrR family transcriptional regulator
LGTVGWSGTTVRAVCAEAGLSSRLFYEAFTGLDELALAVYDEIVDDVFSQVADAAVQGTDVHVRAHNAVRTWVGALADDPRRGRVALSNGPEQGPLGQRRAASIARLIEELAVIDRTERSGAGPPTALSRITTTLLGGGVVELMTAYLHGRLDVGREELVHHCACLVVGIGEVANRLDRHTSQEKSQ